MIRDVPKFFSLFLKIFENFAPQIPEKDGEDEYLAHTNPRKRDQLHEQKQEKQNSRNRCCFSTGDAAAQCSSQPRRERDMETQPQQR